MENQETTVFKSFVNISDLMAKTANYKIYIELSNGYFIPATKSNIKKVAVSMKRNNEELIGYITFLSGGKKGVQVRLIKQN